MSTRKENMTTKKCPRCKKEKTLDLFNKHRGTKDGLQGYCKACQIEIQEIKYLDPKFVKRQRELVLKSGKIYNQTPRS